MTFLTPILKLKMIIEANHHLQGALEGGAGERVEEVPATLTMPHNQRINIVQSVGKDLQVKEEEGEEVVTPLTIITNSSRM